MKIYYKRFRISVPLYFRDWCRSCTLYKVEATFVQQQCFSPHWFENALQNSTQKNIKYLFQNWILCPIELTEMKPLLNEKNERMSWLLSEVDTSWICFTSNMFWLYLCKLEHFAMQIPRFCLSKLEFPQFKEHFPCHWNSNWNRVSVILLKWLLQIVSSVSSF